MPANLLPLRLYQILEEQTDPDHPLPMRELLRLLLQQYGISTDRRTVYSALETLRYVGCNIPLFQDEKRGYCLLARQLEPSEVRLLLDAVSAFPGIGREQYQGLQKKLLQGLSVHQRKECRPLSLPLDYRGCGRSVFLTVEVLEEAISARRQVSFQYMAYGLDKKLHPRRELPYQVSPYGLCFANGNYYLLCRYGDCEALSHYRVDRIQSPEVLDDPAAPLPDGVDLSRYVRERVYQISGESIRAVLRCEDSLLSDVLDRFGMGTALRDLGDGTFEASVTAEPTGLKFWAMQYMERCEVLKPDFLRLELAQIFQDGWTLYHDSR